MLHLKLHPLKVIIKFRFDTNTVMSPVVPKPDGWTKHAASVRPVPFIPP
jgi:hypothetical protein